MQITIPWLPLGVFGTFLTLKLTETTDWSWWVVVSPILISLGLGLVTRLFRGL